MIKPQNLTPYVFFSIFLFHNEPHFRWQLFFITLKKMTPNIFKHLAIKKSTLNIFTWTDKR